MILDFFGHTYYHHHADRDEHRDQSPNYHYYYASKNRDSYPSYYKGAQYDYKSYEPYLPSYGGDRNRGQWGLSKDKWGSYGGYYGNNNKHQDSWLPGKYLPSEPGARDWARYGGSYGTGGGDGLAYVGYKDSYDYWGLGHRDSNMISGYEGYYYTRPNIHKSPEPGIKYLPASYDHGYDSHVPDKNLIPPVVKHDDYDGHGVVYPPKQFDRPGINYVKDGKLLPSHSLINYFIVIHHPSRGRNNSNSLYAPTAQNLYPQ